MSRLHPLAAALALAFCAQTASAQTLFSTFTPIAASVAAGALPEASPFVLSSANFSQRSVADRTTQLAAGQFNTGSWDMIDTNRTGPDAGRYLFSVFETAQAGVQRYDTVTGNTVTLWASPAAAPALNSAVAFDASRWTPFGTYLTAEENWGSQPQPYGRLFELTNPTSATTGTGTLLHRNAVARVSHEGLAFDRNNSLYYIDELNGGSLYKYSSATPTNGATYFNGGVNSVLRVGTGAMDNATGASSWVAFTDVAGVGLAGSVTITDPNGIVSVDGRATTNTAAFLGTNYQRPEDLEIQTLANGDQILYVATTTTNQVYSLNLATNEMKLFVSRNTIDAATGLAVGSAFTSPDNLAIDAAGNIYVVEDQPGGAADIWFATDTNRDGVAESMSRWATLSTVGAEPTGLYFDLFNSNRAFVNVQHPASGVDRLIEISAVPEPGTYAMLLGGLALLAGITRRRNAR